MSHRLSFRLPADAEREPWAHALVERFPVGRARAVRRRRIHFDTFDGRLFAASRLLWLERGGRRTEVVSLRGEGEGAERRAPGPMPAFAAELAESMRSALARRAGARRLLATLELSEEGWSRPILDEHRQAVGRLELVACSPQLPGASTRAEAALWLRLLPDRRFAGALAPIAEWLGTEHRLEGCSAAQEYALALAAIGSSPERFALKTPIPIVSGEPAGASARRVLAHLFRLLRAGEDGVRRELDSEFLHDYRVTLRRLRSVVRELAEALPAEEVETLRKDLEWLGRVSGPKRDLDVLAASWEGYLEGLPSWVGAGLAPLGELCRRRRSQEQEQLAVALASERYLALARGWERFLARRPRATSEPAARPAAELVQRRLVEVIERMLRRAEKAEERARPEALHRLRIAAKRLRYLLEVFRSLFEPERVARCLKVLRGVQDVLGAYNDVVIHQRMIHTMAVEAAGSPPSADVLLAAGYLLAELDRRLEGARERAAAQLRQLLRPSRRERLHRLASHEEDAT